MGTRDHCWSSHHVKSPTAPGVFKPVQNVSSSFNERNCTVITTPHSLPVQNLILTWNVISLFSLNEICLNELSLLDFFLYIKRIMLLLFQSYCIILARISKLP